VKITLVVCEARESGPPEWTDLAIETGVACNPFQADVRLTLDGKVFEVEPEDLVALGKAMEGYLAQRREAERLMAQTSPHVQWV